MKFNILKTRRGKLESKLNLELSYPFPRIDVILKAVDDYEKDNLSTIDKLKKERNIDSRRINGAIKQTIKAHGPITMLLIGSCTKRIIGALIDGNKKKTLKQTILLWLKK